MSLTLRFLVPTLLLVILPLSILVTPCDSSDPSSIHEVLRRHGLPAGLFPEGIKSYKLDQNGALEVNLGRPCLAQYETAVFFDTVVRANLTFGQLRVFNGMSREELFLWLPVKDIMVTDPGSGLIVIDIGYAFKRLSFSRFDDPPVCRSLSGIEMKVVGVRGGRKGIGFQDM